jgi:hypothetical protein
VLFRAQSARLVVIRYIDDRADHPVALLGVTFRHSSFLSAFTFLWLGAPDLPAGTCNCAQTLRHDAGCAFALPARSYFIIPAEVVV